MSMNVLIYATRKVTFKKKNGKRSGNVQIVEFRALQTPTQITYDILASKDPAQTYIDWVLAECSVDQMIGNETYNHGKEHVEEFHTWIKDVEENGFTVKYEMI